VIFYVPGLSGNIQEPAIGSLIEALRDKNQDVRVNSSSALIQIEKPAKGELPIRFDPKTMLIAE